MAASRTSWISLVCFLTGSATCLLPCLGFFCYAIDYVWKTYYICIIVLYIVIYNTVIRAVLKRAEYRNGVRAGFLGATFGVGLLVSLYDSHWVHFGWYLTALAFFHWSEFYTTAVTNPRALTLESYLLDHSREYKLAAMASWLEFTVECFLFPNLKQLQLVSIVGLLLVVGGEFLRKVSMMTASTNFNHYVQHRKHEDHHLVTHGVYCYFRHPSYVGWFYWSVGTQLVLCNPLCLLAYTAVSWRFFRERIHEEELYLLHFFGEEYVDYQRKVPTGLPFISGYIPHV